MAMVANANSDFFILFSSQDIDRGSAIVPIEGYSERIVSLLSLEPSDSPARVTSLAETFHRLPTFTGGFTTSRGSVDTGRWGRKSQARLFNLAHLCL